MRDYFTLSLQGLTVINFIDTICHVIIFVIETFNYFLVTKLTAHSLVSINNVFCTEMTMLSSWTTAQQRWTYRPLAGLLLSVLKGRGFATFSEISRYHDE